MFFVLNILFPLAFVTKCWAWYLNRINIIENINVYRVLYFEVAITTIISFKIDESKFIYV